jgi:glycosyltransferase involved in cell wall biosynthesis
MSICEEGRTEDQTSLTLNEAESWQNCPLRVAYDAQAFLSKNGGTGKGVQLKNLIGPYSESFVGFATSGRSYSNWPLIQGGISKYQLWQQLSLPGLLRKWGADYFLAPYNTAPLILPKRTRLILVLHDLILLEPFPVANLRQRVNDTYRRFLIPKAVARAHTILTVSSYTKQQIIKRFRFARVKVISCSIAQSWFVNEGGGTIGERENQVLVITSSAPHKNADRAIKGYAAFVAKSDRSRVPRLRVVGLADCAESYRKLASAHCIGDLVTFEPYLTEGQLQDLYRRSRAVLVPSLMEGFGIPVLEAMASGTPVIASNSTSLPEVGGPAAAYFDPTDIRQMAEMLQQVLGDQHRQQHMIELGFTQAKQFHPDLVRREVQAFWSALGAGSP